MDYLAKSTIQEVKIDASNCRNIHGVKSVDTYVCTFCSEKLKKNVYVSISTSSNCVCCDKKVKIGDCRGLHTTTRDHTTDAKICPYCTEKVKRKTFVETQNGVCACCRNVIPQQKTFDVLARIMNQFVQEYGYMLDSWLPSINPKEGKTVVRIKHRMFHYETDIKWVGLYMEIANLDRLPFPAPTNPVNKVFKICPFCMENNVSTMVELYDDDEEDNCTVCGKAVNRRGKTTTLGPFVDWDWEHSKVMPMKESVKIQEMWDSYDKWNSVMKVINKHVVRVLL